MGNALLDAPPNLNSALRPQIGGQQNIDVLLRPRKQEPLPNAVERNSALPLVARIDVLIALGIVELFDSGRDNLVPRRHLSEVNGRLSDIQAILRFGEEYSQEDIAEGLPLSVFDTKFITSPSPWVNSRFSLTQVCACCGQLRREFPGCKHHLMVAIRQMVSIDIHVIELVVKTNRLGLLIGLKQWPRIPETDVLDRILISRDHVGSQIGESRISGFLDCRQAYKPFA